MFERELSKPFGLDIRFFGYLVPYRLHLVGALIAALLIAAMEVVLPWPLKYIIDNVLGDAPLSDPVGRLVTSRFGDDPRLLSLVFGVLVIVLTALRSLFSFLHNYLKGTLQARSTWRLRSDLFARLQLLSLQFHDRSYTSDVSGRVNGDAARIMEALVGSAAAVVVSLCTFIGIVGTTLLVNWRFSLLALAYLPLLLLVFSRFHRRITASTATVRTQEGQMAKVAQQAVGAIRVVQAYGREDGEQRRFNLHGASHLRAEVRATRWQAALDPVVDVVKACGFVALLWYGVAQVFAAQLTVGELILVLAYLMILYSPLRQLGQLADTLQHAAISGERVAELLDSLDVVRDTPDNRPLLCAEGHVTFQGVSFGYDHRGAVLHDLTFEVAPGQVVGIVGPTGVGKSTILHLLLRFYDAWDGQIQIDGTDIRRIRLRDLRKQFALVTQEPILFAASIHENIAYGQPYAELPDVIAAAKAAYIHDFISQLPQGYNTELGEGGATLSEGQRQQIAIARAILVNAPILILDEPTAALDAVSEREAMRALVRLMEGRTTFITAHRLSTIRNADLILVLDQGTIAEQGTHDQLLALNGRYAALLRLQQSRPTEVLLTRELGATSP